jgi:signal transduction histidine kinase
VTTRAARHSRLRYPADGRESGQLPIVRAEPWFAALQCAVDALLLVDGDAIIAASNAAAERIFGYDERGLVGTALEDIIGGPVAAGSVVERDGLRADGRSTPIEVSVGAMGADGYALVIVRNVRARRDTERMALEVAEERQMRIGQDLHDGVGQLVTGIGYLASCLEHDLAGAARLQAARLTVLAEEATAQIRSLARGLSPLHLDRRDLAGVLTDLATESARLYGVRCRFEDDAGTDAEELAVRTQIYMIVREAITNAIKHGGATDLSIVLEQVGGQSQVSIRDDGRGLPTSVGRRGLGLRSMEHRARLIGGTLAVIAEQPGTTVRCRW